MAVTEVAAHSEQTSRTKRIRLDVTGMSCGACSRRVENTLNKVDGVQATVDISTKIATVDARHDITVAELCDAVERAGYHAEERTAGHDDQSAPAPKSPSIVARAIRWVTVGHMGG
ncbi:cation transporter [Mycolicibacterium senegalense]|uniref:cation transporter n=1 Tax=Mycolicibacterium TaxID=1866885 RepID=UPI001F3DCD70|nr:heavy metal-associated domain-containing protein [Mycolicibacterium conceptionense]